MISILKKFVLTEWIKSFFVSFMALFILMTVAELITGFLRSNVTPLEVVINYCFNIPEYTSRILPISTLMGTLFSINKLKAHSELMAILASGFSATTIIFLIFICSFMVSISQLAILGKLIPQTKIWRTTLLPENLKNKFSESKEKGLKTSSLATGVIWYKSKDYYVSFKAFNKETNEIIGPSIFYFNENYKGKTFIRAQIAQYQKENQWNLFNAIEVKFLDENTYPIFFNHKNLLINLYEVPKDFDQIESDIETLDLINLKRFIDHLKQSGINVKEYESNYFKIYAQALICIIFALFPAFGIFEPNRRSSSFGKSVIFTLIFTFAFFVIYSAVSSLGTAGHLPIALAVGLVPLISLFYILFKLYFHRKL